VKKILPILVLLGACAPDITQDAAPPETIIVNFDLSADPKVVPLPNDLALLDPAHPGTIFVPPSATDSPAQKEFNEQYLGKLNGFPYESTASVTVSAELKPESVSAKSVLAFDVTDPKAPLAVAIAPTYANKKITIPPPAGNWLRAHKYAIATLGGPNGLRGAQDQNVVGSQTWALVSSRNPLVTCTDLKAPDCAPAVDIIPSTKTDPAERLKEETASAIQLEQLRLGYKPILDRLAQAPIDADRSIVPIVWTFTIVDAGEMTFDPANKVIPFPNDLVRTGPKGTVQLPHPKTGAPLMAADCNTTDSSILLICGLNTLDGFSTLAPLISENSDKAGALDQGLIDAKSLTQASVGLVKLKSDAPTEIQTTPKWTPCLNCQSSAKADGTPSTSPQQLQWKLDAPLDEKTTYFGYVSGAVKDSAGKGVIANPVFALVRSSAPLLDAAGKSTVSLISDDQAKQLEPVRAAFAPAFDGLAKAGIQRADLALAFPFTTQSESTILDTLYGVPKQAAALGLPDVPVVTAKGAIPPGVPATDIDAVYGGIWLTPVAVTGPGGTLNPDPTKIKILPVKFAITVPTDTVAHPKPAGGWPVTIFGHGITRSRTDFLALANSLAAAGQVVISTDTIYHGDRTSCTGSKASIPGATDDAAACADPINMQCDGGFQGLCVLKAAASRMTCQTNVTTDPSGDFFCLGNGQGRCAADNKCQGAGADFLRDAGGRPQISGWNMFSLTNFFATRDNFRQQVIDLSQLVNIVKSTKATNLVAQINGVSGGPAMTFDTTKIGYVGQSLGGILGTLFNSVSPDTTNVVLNVPGGALVSIILNAPSFAPAKKALLDTLAGNGLLPGSPGFDQFLGIAQWVLDEADPANMGYRLTHPVKLASGVTAPNVNRKAFIQFIQGDETVPNVSNLALVVGANRDFVPTPPSFGCKAPLFCYEFTEAGDGFDTTSAPTNKRHGFLLAPPSGTGGAITAKAQGQAAKFLATGVFP
jgi:hypothetical protein